MRVCGYILILCVISASVWTVSLLILGEICSTDSECEADIEHSECEFTVPCTERGHCSCVAGYGNATGDGCDKILRSHGNPCDDTTYCHGDNEVCDPDNGNCTCALWYYWNTIVGRCILQEVAVHTQACGDRFDEDTCLVSEDEGGLCDETCMCIPGYTMNWKNLTCDFPIYGEACESEPLCVMHFDPATVSRDVSSTEPTCQSNVCRCPLSHDHKYVNGYHLCLNKVDNDTVLKADGDLCEQFNECLSSFCYTCPDETDGRCYSNPTELIDYQGRPQADFRLLGALLVMAAAFF